MQPICTSYPKLKVDLFSQISNYIKDTDETWNYITPKELYNFLIKRRSYRDKPFLLDIRRQEDYSISGHIPGSVNIFWKDLFKPGNLGKLPCPKHEPDILIILVCYVGHTSSQTLTLLKLLGFKVISVKFGMGISPSSSVPIQGWIERGYPVEYGPAPKFKSTYSKCHLEHIH